MMGRMIAGGSAADGAPQYNGNMGAPANYWQGNQMMIPGLAQGMQGMGGQPGAPMMQNPQSALMALIEMLKQKQ